MTPEEKQEHLLAMAEEFQFRVLTMKSVSPSFDEDEYKPQFCHERCITINELNTALDDLDDQN